ncbi:putative CRISPR-associated protein [Calidithermus roseus]|uniref:Putative CRISPR-associated protein n=1 Tax=Calidithermus roseus TaxID=1644118 RepID=A0A399EX55_9DEIN|nr:putative CRISPR-associated protein [Calidithermus roseus]RIH86871.1 putative CRISPR-associated protein [Calidithermus roseus]
MSTVILTTVGTSLLGNIARAGIGKEDARGVLEFIRSDPAKASAETNSLGRLLRGGERVELLHSDTEEGRWCAVWVATYLREKGFSVELFKVQGLAYEARGFVDYGLRQFVQLLAGRIREVHRQGHQAAINATGGFKAEIAYATALGLVFKVPVYYIHEKFGDIVTLPPSPFGWDNSLIAWNTDFFDWIDAELRPTSEVRSRVRGLPAEIGLLLEEMPDGYTVLSPLGQAYLEAFRCEFEQAQSVPVYFSPKARATWENLEPAAQERYQKLLQRLRLPNRAANSELKSGGGDVLGYPKGRVDERLFYAERDGGLYVFALTRHGPGYERMCQEGFSWRDFEPAEFTLWEG